RHAPRAPARTLFPYTTLFRSDRAPAGAAIRRTRRDARRRRGARGIPRAPADDAVSGPAPRVALLDDAAEAVAAALARPRLVAVADRKSTRLNSSHLGISYAVF